METGERIQQRRKELGMTQDDLAVALGYKSRSSINKIEKGEREIPVKLLNDLAAALFTTTEYILGSNDVPSKEESDFRKILSLFNRMNEIQIEKWISYAEGLLEQED